MGESLSCVHVGHDHPRPVYLQPDHLRGYLGASTGRGVRIAVVDSGWDRAISCPQVAEPIGVADPEEPFKVKLSPGWDEIGHGTACADIILRLAPEAEIIPIRVFGADLETSLPVLLAAMDVAARAGAQLINMSLGTMLTYASDPLADRCVELAESGVFVIAAAQKAGISPFPAALDSAVGVTVGDFANAYELQVDSESPGSFRAHGRHRRVPALEGAFADVKATSYAVPSATGIAALLLERYGPLTLDELKARLADVAALSTGGESTGRVGVHAKEAC